MADRSPTPGPSGIKRHADLNNPPDAYANGKRQKIIDGERELLASLVAMFPETPLEYLEEQGRNSIQS